MAGVRKPLSTQAGAAEACVGARACLAVVCAMLGAGHRRRTWHTAADREHELTVVGFPAVARDVVPAADGSSALLRADLNNTSGVDRVQLSPAYCGVSPHREATLTTNVAVPANRPRSSAEPSSALTTRPRASRQRPPPRLS